MLQTWVAEDGDELPVAEEAFLGEAEERMERWNEHGRRLCEAFLAAAA
jgi:hypothetical protein